MYLNNEVVIDETELKNRIIQIRNRLSQDKVFSINTSEMQSVNQLCLFVAKRINLFWTYENKGSRKYELDFYVKYKYEIAYLIALSINDYRELIRNLENAIANVRAQTQNYLIAAYYYLANKRGSDLFVEYVLEKKEVNNNRLIKALLLFICIKHPKMMAEKKQEIREIIKDLFKKEDSEIDLLIEEIINNPNNDYLRVEENQMRADRFNDNKDDLFSIHSSLFGEWVEYYEDTEL